MSGSLRREEKIRPPASGARPGASDPWQAASATKTGEQGGWLLSYLDVMTLLFSFFVLLFAYQKSMIAEDAKPAQTASARTEIAAKAEAPPALAQEERPESSAAAIAAMKAQAALHEVAREVADVHPASEKAPAHERPMQLKPALDAMAHVGRAILPEAAASEQTAAQFSGALAKETAQKQVDIIRAAHEVRLEVSDAILFDPGSAALRPQGLAMLDRLTAVLARQPGIVSVEGHSDHSPIANAQFPSNWELSSARATAVTRHLIQKGIPADRLRAVGMADTKPRDSEATAEGRAKNRRVSLIVYLEGANPGASVKPSKVD